MIQYFIVRQINNWVCVWSTSYWRSIERCVNQCRYCM